MFKLKNAFGWRSATTVIWAFVAMSGWYWTQAVIAAGSPISADAAPAVVMRDISSPAVLARLLGATALAEAGPAPGAAERFVLSGVIASSAGQGAALISVDGKPARPFAIGSELAPGYVLVSVASKQAILAEGFNAPVRAVLSLPLQRTIEGLVAPQRALGTAANASGAAIVPLNPVAGAPAVVPMATAEQSPPVAPRADARRQPQTTLRREDQRVP